MFEKVNPDHPDKCADRISGALVDFAYAMQDEPRIAVEAMLGHGSCFIIAETSVHIPAVLVEETVERIAGKRLAVTFIEVPQDPLLAGNQEGKIRCGDNGIFRGMPVTDEQRKLTGIARRIYERYGCDGKYILDGERLIICQSNASGTEILGMYPDAEANPIGEWTGGPDVDTGAVNRKLGSDMADSVTGGGLHGKDLSKADVSVNIYAWLKAQETGKPVEISCAIGDGTVDGKPYAEIVETAREFIRRKGGFEKFAEWGLL